jgi:prepilin-type N-terminal cleavage/methylation domain-containing protein
MTITQNTEYTQKRGFTLVELLVYMALMSIFILVLLDIFTITLNTKLASESTSALSQDSRYILSKLSYDVNNADSITSPSLGSTSASLQLVASGSAVTYASNSGNLVKTVSGVSMNMNSIDTKLDSISFKNIGNPGGKPTIQVVYTVRSKIIVQGGGTQAQTINTTVGTR